MRSPQMWDSLLKHICSFVSLTTNPKLWLQSYDWTKWTWLANGVSMWYTALTCFCPDVSSLDMQTKRKKDDKTVRNKERACSRNLSEPALNGGADTDITPGPCTLSQLILRSPLAQPSSPSLLRLVTLSILDVTSAVDWRGLNYLKLHIWLSILGFLSLRWTHPSLRRSVAELFLLLFPSVCVCLGSGVQQRESQL